MTLRVGVIGCGVIGSTLARFLHKENDLTARVRYFYDIDRPLSKKLSKKIGNCASLHSIQQIVQKSDFLIEAASPAAAREVVPLACRLRKPTLLMSGGGLVMDPKLMKRILSGKTRFYLPSGAVPGIDGLLAAKESGLKRVVITTHKSLKSLAGAPFFERHPEKLHFAGTKKVIFEGAVSQAICYFPQNLNVAALLSLAGSGLKKTRVRLVAYKKLTTNTHEIEVSSRAGKMLLKTENLPHEINPKTSALAIYSAQAFLRKLFSPLSLGT